MDEPGGGGGTHLEESLQPPDLENTLSDNHGQLEDTPPLNPRIGALCRVPVHAFTNHDIRLFVFDLGEGFRETTNYALLVPSPIAGYNKGDGDIPSVSNGSCSNSESGT